MVLEKVASADQVADSLTKSMPKPAFEKHRASMMGLQLDPGDPVPSLALLESRIIATGANAEDIEMDNCDDDCDDNEHGMIALGDVAFDLTRARPSLYDSSTVVLAVSLFSVVYGVVTVIAMLIPM
eukprot:1973158-Rhodomonas_salina.1